MRIKHILSRISEQKKSSELLNKADPFFKKDSARIYQEVTSVVQNLMPVTDFDVYASEDIRSLEIALEKAFLKETPILGVDMKLKDTIVSSDRLLAAPKKTAAEADDKNAYLDIEPDFESMSEYPEEILDSLRKVVPKAIRIYFRKKSDKLVVNWARVLK